MNEDFIIKIMKNIPHKLLDINQYTLNDKQIANCCIFLPLLRFCDLFNVWGFVIYFMSRVSWFFYFSCVIILGLLVGYFNFPKGYRLKVEEGLPTTLNFAYFLLCYTIPRDAYLEIKFNNRKKIDDKIALGLGEGFLYLH